MDNENIFFVCLNLFLIGSIFYLADISFLEHNQQSIENFEIGEDYELRCPELEPHQEERARGLIGPYQDRMSDSSFEPIPAYKLETNRHGIRDNEFKLQKPENQLRILVIGDSMTYGLGVNKSDRYTEVLERKLDKNTSKDVEVINLGLQATGMRDFYQMLLEPGRRFEPDIVVVTYSEEDMLSWQRKQKFIEKEKEERGIPDSTSIYHNEEKEEALKGVQERIRNYRQQTSWAESEYRIYMEKILSLGEEESFDVHMFRITGTEHEPRIASKPVEELEYELVYDYWREECNENMISRPENLRYNETYTFYPDPHFNPRGNQLMGERLYEGLKKYNYFQLE